MGSLKVGTKVRIRNCEVGKLYGSLRFLPGMTRALWETNKVVYANDTLGRYLLDNGMWYTAEMLEII